MKVSLIATVKDGAEHLDEFLGSLRGQSRAPDEVVIVDGGSTDGTVDQLRRADGIVVIEELRANIARGRNVAIANTTHDVIAVTDADCVLEPPWLERLLRPIEEGADVAMGFYVPIADGFLQACVAAVNLPHDDLEIDGTRFMPSARSVAFRRTAIESAGGYPEWLDIGEDMWVNHRWRRLGRPGNVTGALSGRCAQLPGRTGGAAASGAGFWAGVAPGDGTAGRKSLTLTRLRNT